MIIPVVFSTAIFSTKTLMYNAFEYRDMQFLRKILATLEILTHDKRKSQFSHVKIILKTTLQIILIASAKENHEVRSALTMAAEGM